MHTFTYGGKEGTEYQLVEAQDMVVVRTKGPELQHMPLSGTSRSLLPHMLPVASFPEAHVTVYKIVDSTQESALKMRNSIRRQLKDEEGIVFAGRVLKDQKSGTIFVYTENIFVKFRDELSAEGCEAIIGEKNLKIKEKLVFAKNAYFTECSEGTGMGVFSVAEELLKMKEVQYCHPELVMEKKHKFVHPMQWHLRSTNINGHQINQHVNVEEAWEQSRGKDTIIAVIDDGVDYRHEEFSMPGKVVAPRDTITNRDDALPKYDSENHGTACAGVACASGEKLASGVAPAAKLMPIRSGGLGSMAEAKAFAWAAEHGADVISCSWGPRDGAWWNPNDPQHTYNFVLPDSTRMAIDFATEQGRNGKGCVIVWAAGNGNEDVAYDGYASYERVIAVAACNDRGKRSVYSDFGDAVWCSFPSSDIYVPEFNHPRPLSAGIWTTDRPGERGYNAGGVNAVSVIGDMEGHYTASFGGTSSACPGVAGVVALMLSVNPDLTWLEIKKLLRDSCDKIDEEGGGYDANGHSVYYGYGRVNAALAVRNAKGIQESLDNFEVGGSAYFNYDSTLGIKNGRLTSDDYARNRLVGIRLRAQPFHPEMGIRYRVFIHKVGPSEWAENGTWTGTMDRRRKLVGIQVELTGPLADKYDVVYEVLLQGRKALEKGMNGTVAGTDSIKGKAIKEIKITIHKK